MGRERRSTAVRAARLLEAAASQPGERYGRLMEVFPAETRVELLDADFVPRPAPAWQLLGPPPADGIAGLQLLDIQTYLPGDLLLKADIASMAHSLELRSPFLDWEVLELGVSLPRELKAKGRRGKEALRRAFADDLPDDVVERGKSGFGVPLADWFRDGLRELAGDVLLDSRARNRGQLRPRAVERLLRTTSRAAPTTRTGSGAYSCSSCGSGRTSTVEPARRICPRGRRSGRAAARRPTPRARGHPRLLHGEERPVRPRLCRRRDVRLPPRRAVRVDAAALFVLPHSDLLDAGREWWAVGVAQIAVAGATAIVVYEIGRRFLSHRAGLVAAVVATLSPYLVWHDVHVNRELLDQLLAAVVVLMTLVVGERRGGLAAPRCSASRSASPSSATRGSSCFRSSSPGYLLWRRKGWQPVG